VKLRRIASLFLLVSTLFLLATSLVLYVVPQGRVAYWTHWRLWGFTKTDWTNLHINLGLLILVAAGLHVYYNWRAIVSYLTHRSRRSRILSGDFITALVLTAFVVVGTPLGLPPMRWVLNLNESVKDAASQRYGEPPYGHAELSTLETFARRMELDLSAVMERLSAAGFVVSSSQATLEDLAAANRVTPQALYGAMAPPSEKAEAPPRIPPPGTGKKKLADLCAEYDLDVDRIVALLAAEGLEVHPGQTLRDIATDEGLSPNEIYERVRLATLRATFGDKSPPAEDH